MCTRGAGGHGGPNPARDHVAAGAPGLKASIRFLGKEGATILGPGSVATFPAAATDLLRSSSTRLRSAAHRNPISYSLSQIHLDKPYPDSVNVEALCPTSRYSTPSPHLQRRWHRPSCRRDSYRPRRPRFHPERWKHKRRMSPSVVLQGRESPPVAIDLRDVTLQGACCRAHV